MNVNRAVQIIKRKGSHVKQVSKCLYLVDGEGITVDELISMAQESNGNKGVKKPQPKKRHRERRNRDSVDDFGDNWK